MAGPSYTAVHGRGANAGSDDSVLPAVTVSVQRADPAVADATLRWQTLPGTTVTLTRSVTGTAATWTGDVSVPDGGGELRLLVVEEERLFTDGTPAATETLTSRVVFASAVPL